MELGNKQGNGRRVDPRVLLSRPVEQILQAVSPIDELLEVDQIPNLGPSKQGAHPACWWEAELHRLKGEVLLAAAGDGDRDHGGRAEASSQYPVPPAQIKNPTAIIEHFPARI